MAAYINLVYGEMFGAWLFHLFIPFFLSKIVINMFGESSVFNKMIFLLGFSMILSFVCQFILLLIIQTNSCSTIKNIGNVALGSVIGAIIVGVMMCVPLFVEPMRLVVSQLYKPHKPLMSPQLEQLQKQLVYMSVPTVQKGGAGSTETKAVSPEVPADTKVTSQKEPAPPISPQKIYDMQTYDEFTFGGALWAAFGGAYGVGIGSLYAGKC